MGGGGEGRGGGVRGREGAGGGGEGAEGRECAGVVWLVLTNSTSFEQRLNFRSAEAPGPLCRELSRLFPRFRACRPSLVAARGARRVCSFSTLVLSTAPPLHLAPAVSVAVASIPPPPPPPPQLSWRHSSFHPVRLLGSSQPENSPPGALSHVTLQPELTLAVQLCEEGRRGPAYARPHTPFNSSTLCSRALTPHFFARMKSINLRSPTFTFLQTAQLQ